MKTVSATFSASSSIGDLTLKLRAAAHGIRSLLVAVGMLTVSGCMTPVMQPSVGLNYVPSSGLPWIHAQALLPFGGGISEAVMIDVSISLAVAPPFTIVFPDGFRVPSRTVTAEVLRDHSDSLGKPSRINTELAEFHKLKWDSSDGVTVIFELIGEQVNVLRFCSPARLPDMGARSLSFIASDGTAVTFPVTYSSMTHLFGPHVGAGRDFLFAKLSC